MQCQSGMIGESMSGLPQFGQVFTFVIHSPPTSRRSSMLFRSKPCAMGEVVLPSPILPSALTIASCVLSILRGLGLFLSCSFLRVVELPSQVQSGLVKSLLHVRSLLEELNVIVTMFLEPLEEVKRMKVPHSYK